MSHQDQGRSSVRESHLQALNRTLSWWLHECDTSSIAFRDDCSWIPRSLLTAALLGALGDEKNLTDRFARARKITAHLFRRQEPAGSYQAFLKMLKKWTGTLMASVVLCFRRRMQQGDAGEFLTAGFAVFAVDGSRVELPRSASNQEAYCAKKKQANKKAVSGDRRRRRKAGNVAKKKRRTTNRQARRRSRRGRSAQQKLDNPNAWVTTMWHVGTGLPGDWRIGPFDSSERDHLRQMTDDLPPAALVTADAGFVGYEYCKGLLDSDRHFVIRVAASVKLLKKLGYARESSQSVSLWPDKAAARQQPP